MAFGDLVQSVANATANSSTSVSVSITTATSGSLLVCVHFTGDGNSTAPSGFTEAVAVTDSGNSDQGAIYWKIAAGSESSVAPGSDNNDEHMATVYEIEGPWESSPVDQTATNDATSESTTSSGTTGTTSQADEFAVVGLTCRQTAVAFAGWTNSFTEGSDIGSNYKALGTAYKVLTSTGTVETSASHSGPVTSMGMIATFKKQAAGGGGLLNQMMTYNHFNGGVNHGPG